MKRITVSVLVLVLATGGSAAIADRRHHDHHGTHGHGYHHSHYKAHWYARPYYRNVYHYPYHDHYDGYFPLGASLVGAAITYSLVHRHASRYAEPVGSTEVVGCHRIERFPDGREVRVEVPIGECY